MKCADRLDLFRRALTGVRTLQAQTPNDRTLHAMTEQLEYLIDCVEGKTDGGRLNEIVLGLQTARELEGREESVIDMLYYAASEADVMMKSRAIAQSLR